MNRSKTKLLVFILCVSSLVLLTTVLIGALKAGKPVAVVNGEPVDARELELQMELERANVYNYFYKKYGAEDGPGFWTKSFGGEVPGEVLRKKALEKCVRIKIQQILAKNHGIAANDISYAAFLKALKAENKKRAEAARNNEVVYGKLSYDEAAYYQYLLDNDVIRLKRMLFEGELETGGDEVLRKFYEANKEKLFSNGRKVRVQKIYVSSVDENHKITDKYVHEARRRIEEAKKKIDFGEKFDVVAAQYNIGGGTGEEIILENPNSRAMAGLSIKLRENALNLSAGQVSGIIELEDKMSFVILHCVERNENDYLDYEKNKERIKAIYIDYQYEEMVDRLTEEAGVQINASVFNNCVVN
jgi:hypothetical protein